MRSLMLAMVVLLMVATAASASPLRGAGCRTDVVRPDGNNIYMMEFRGGEATAISVSGDGDTDLDITVLDEFGNVVAIASGLSDTENIGWVPSVTGTYFIVVMNHGDVYNRYQFCVS